MTAPVHVVSVGPLGRAIARHLRSLRADTVETSGEAGVPPDPPAARLTVVASWRPAPALCEWWDAHSHERGRPFIPVVADSAILSVGPVIVPGASACWRCWIRRTRQHAPGLSRKVALWRHYAEQTDAGPQGYLEPFALAAAARVSQMVDALERGEAVAGQVWQVHMISRRITLGTVVGVHGCPRCGLGREAAARSHADMREALASLWSAP